MKKAKNFSALFLALLLIFTAFPAAMAETNQEFIVKSKSAPVFLSPAFTSKKIGEVQKGTYLNIIKTENGFGRTKIPSSGIWGWIPMEDLEAVIKTDVSSIKGIEVTPPDKTEYTDGDPGINTTGMAVYIIYKDGTRKSAYEYNVFSPALTSPGEKTVTVTYSPKNSGVTFSDTFKIHVNRLPIKKIEIASMPDKTEYIEHEVLDLTGLKVRIVFENEEDNRIAAYNEISEDPYFKIEGCCENGGKIEKGEQKFTVTYKYEDITCDFTLNARERRLADLKIQQYPDELTVYTNKEKPSLDGMLLTAVYDNGEEETVYPYQCRFECDPGKFVIGPGNKADVYYGDLKVTLEFRYSISEEAGIKLKLPQILTFRLGDKIELPGFKVLLYYTDGTYVEVKDYEMTKIDPTLIGKQNIVVTYKGYSEVFTITITEFFGIGDVDGDGKITANDARQALRGSVGLVKLAGLTFTAADTNKDGKVTAEDARKILRVSVNLESF